MKNYLVNKKNIPKSFFGNCLFIWVLLILSSNAKADEVKFFEKWDCDSFRIDNRCKFYYEIGSSDLVNAWFYFEVRFRQGKLINATRFALNAMELYGKKPKQTIAEKLEFDSNERIIHHEIFLHDPSPNKYRLCKVYYEKQIKVSQCFDKKGKMTHKIIWVYKGNLLAKRSWYDASGQLKEYSVFDQETKTEKIFASDHRLREKKSMDWYVN